MIKFSNRDLNTSGFYDRQYDYELMQESIVNNMRLNITRQESSNYGLNKRVTYKIIFMDGLNVVYRSLESNLERVFYLYDTIHHSMQ
jgi:hypothetical protein